MQVTYNHRHQAMSITENYCILMLISADDSKSNRNSFDSFKLPENYSSVALAPLTNSNMSKNLSENWKRDEVTIHVCDEGRKTSKYFFCQRNLLIHVSTHHSALSDDNTLLTPRTNYFSPLISLNSNSLPLFDSI
jgi:hypothetical protein